MTQAKPLLALIDDLRVDATEHAAYTRDPEGYLASQGWAELDPAEFREALGFVRETMPFDVAVTIPDGPVTATDGSLTDEVDGFLGAVRPIDDLEDFGVDATPYELDPFESFVADDIYVPDEPAEEPLTVDLGPVDDEVDDDEDGDDDPFDL